MRSLICAILICLVGFGAVYDGSAQSKQPAKTSQTAKKSSAKKTSSKKSSGASKGKKSSTGGKKGSSGASSTGTKRSAGDVQREKQRTAKEINETKRKIRLNTRETEKRLNQLNLVEGEITECNAHIGSLTVRVDSLNSKIGTVNDSIAALDSRLSAITKKYTAAIRKTQGRHHQMSDLAFIFSSESFAQAYRRMQSLRQFAKWRKRKAHEITDIREQLDKRRQMLSSLSQQANTSVAQLNGEKSNLLKKQAETSSLVAQLKQEGVELQDIMKRRRSEAAALDAELDRIVAEEAARQERLRREREEAERRAREEAARKAEEERLAREEAEAKAREEAARKAQAEAEAEAAAAAKAAEEAKTAEEKKAAKARKEAAEKQRKEAEKQKKEAEKRAKEAAKEARKKKPVKHKGKKGDESGGTEATAPAPTLKTPSSAVASGVAPSSATVSGSNFESCRGQLPMPVAGKYTIVKCFGRQKHPTLPHIEINNSGIDIETGSGAGARVVYDGEVSAVFRPDGYNNVVVVRHGEYMTVYANLSSLSVSTGQKVKAGQTIGTVYADPNDNGRSVLHFEIRHARQKENPEVWLKR